jgi:hypothetical protein
MSLLSKRVTEDGDLRRYIERSDGFVSKGKKRRARMAAARIRLRKELQERLTQDAESNES